MLDSTLPQSESRSWLTRLFDPISYPRGVLVTFFGAFWTLIMSVVVVFVAGVIRPRWILDFFIDYGWCLPILTFSGVRTEVRGRDNVGLKGKGCLLLFNHSSYFDIPVLYMYFPRSFRFGAKIELFKIPLFGWAMRLCG